MSIHAVHLLDLVTFARNAPFLRFSVGMLPLWFLVLSIFLPRVALFLAWLQAFRFPIPFPIDAVFWLVLPRALVLIMIYTRQGLDTWFWIHIVAALVVYGGGTHRIANRG